MATPQEEIQQQAGKVITQVAGYVGVKAIDIGLRQGMLEELAKHPEGLTPDELAPTKSNTSSNGTHRRPFKWHCPMGFMMVAPLSPGTYAPGQSPLPSGRGGRCASHHRVRVR